MKTLLASLILCLGFQCALYCSDAPCYIIPKGKCEDGKCEMVCRIIYDIESGEVHLFSYEDGHMYTVEGDCYLEHADDRCLCFLEDM